MNKDRRIVKKSIKTVLERRVVESPAWSESTNALIVKPISLVVKGWGTMNPPTSAYYGAYLRNFCEGIK